MSVECKIGLSAVVRKEDEHSGHGSAGVGGVGKGWGVRGGGGGGISPKGLQRVKKKSKECWAAS